MENHDPFAWQAGAQQAAGKQPARLGDAEMQRWWHGGAVLTGRARAW